MSHPSHEFRGGPRRSADLLDFGQSHFRQVLCTRFRWNVRDHATAFRIKGNDREYSFFGSKEMHLVFRDRRIDFKCESARTKLSS